MFDCRHRPFRLPDELVGELAAAYGEPHRAYHNASHIAEVLTWFDRVAEDLGWLEPAEVYTAIVFHDAIYQPGAKDNEARSAAWARRSGLPVDVDRVAELVELTAKHGHVTTAEHDTALFLDSDMAILGAAPDAFDAYDRAIAVEYQHVPPDAYRAGRRAFLEGLLAMRRIYLSDYFHRRLDEHARANLRRALTG